jgi:hypothetical protein
MQLNTRISFFKDCRKSLIKFKRKILKCVPKWILLQSLKACLMS